MHVVGGGNRATTANALSICDGLVRRKDAVGDGNGAVRGDRATLVGRRVVVKSAVVDDHCNACRNGTTTLLRVVGVEVRVVDREGTFGDHGAPLNGIRVAAGEGDARHREVPA